MSTGFYRAAYLFTLVLLVALLIGEAIHGRTTVPEFVLNVGLLLLLFTWASLAGLLKRQSKWKTLGE